MIRYVGQWPCRVPQFIIIIIRETLNIDRLEKGELWNRSIFETISRFIFLLILIMFLVSLIIVLAIYLIMMGQLLSVRSKRSSNLPILVYGFGIDF